MSRPHRLSAAELIALVLDEGSWTSWDVPPVRGEISEEYAAELAAAAEKSGVDESVLSGEGLLHGRRVAVLMGVAAFLLYQFRRINGVRVDGLSSQIVLGTGGASTLVYMGGFGAATWAAFESRWWLVAVAAVVAGVGYAFGTFRWWRAYRHDPAAHEGGVSPRVLAVLAVLAFLGFVALLVAG